jgi:hypothetical protein
MSRLKDLMEQPFAAQIVGLALVAAGAMAAYEDIQAEIFDHVLAIAPQFGLRAYQRPSGEDLARPGRSEWTDRLSTSQQRTGERALVAASPHQLLELLDAEVRLLAGLDQHTLPLHHPLCGL